MATGSSISYFSIWRTTEPAPKPITTAFRLRRVKKGPHREEETVLPMTSKLGTVLAPWAG